MFDMSQASYSSFIGALENGLGCSELNKFLACLNIPSISSKTFKEYEREIGTAIETAARTSCVKATVEERELVRQQIHGLREIL